MFPLVSQSTFKCLSIKCIWSWFWPNRNQTVNLALSELYDPMNFRTFCYMALPLLGPETKAYIQCSTIPIKWPLKAHVPWTHKLTSLLVNFHHVKSSWHGTEKQKRVWQNEEDLVLFSLFLILHADIYMQALVKNGWKNKMHAPPRSTSNFQARKQNPEKSQSAHTHCNSAPR